MTSFNLITWFKNSYNDHSHASTEGELLLKVSKQLNEWIHKDVHSLIFEYADSNFDLRVKSEMHRILNSEKWVYPLTSPKNRDFFEHFASSIRCLDLRALALSDDVPVDNLLAVARNLNRLTTLYFYARQPTSTQIMKCQQLVQQLPITRISCHGVDLCVVNAMVNSKNTLTQIQIEGTFLYNSSQRLIRSYENQFHKIFLNCPELTELSIKHQNWGNAISVRWESLRTALQKLPSLTSLNLTNFYYLPFESNHSFLFSLSQLTIRFLDISGIPLEAEDIEQLTYFRQLEVLRMENCCFSANDERSVLSYDYSANSLDGFNIYTAIEAISTLRELNVIGCRLSYNFFHRVGLIRNLKQLYCGGVTLPRINNEAQAPNFYDDEMLYQLQITNPGLQITQRPNIFWFPPRSPSPPTPRTPSPPISYSWTD